MSTQVSAWPCRHPQAKQDSNVSHRHLQPHHTGWVYPLDLTCGYSERKSLPGIPCRQDEMGLRDLTYQEDYRSGEDDLLNDFLKPSLLHANKYWRAVGYFSSSALKSFGAPLGDFVSAGGTIRLITSVELSQEDLAAIEAGMSKQEVCAHRLKEIVESEFGENIGSGIARLTRLLRLGRLEIRIATPKSGTGIYHEKIGIFFDGPQYVAFSGSSNESRSAFENNRECLDVYTSWDSPSRALRKRNHFESVWTGTDKGVEVFPFPEAAREGLIRAVERNYNRAVLEEDEPDKWRHQDEAIEIFLRKKRGVLNMATGTGKTRIAARIIQKLFVEKEIDTAIITMDGNDLLHQWRKELIGVVNSIPHPVRLLSDFENFKEVQDFILEPSDSILLVTRAFGTRRDPLVSSLKKLPDSIARRTLLIHDEVHRLGSPRNQSRLGGLSESVRYRLGLSATPEREYDDEGNEFTSNHIGPVLMTFGLDDAIRRGVLVPFNYHGLPYEVTDDDRERLQAVYRAKSARAATGDPMTNEELWTKLAYVYKTSPAKLPIFDDFIKNNQHLLQRCIIFTESQEYGLQVAELVHKYRADFHTYFTGEGGEVLRRFAIGDLESLVTCHRLSEGIDIKSLNSVILFSSSRSRLETIQRMGRCLRADPSNPSKIATVIDFIHTSDSADEEEEHRATADELRFEWLTALSDIRPQREI